MTYKIVRGLGNYLDVAENNLTKEVNKLIEDGWKPQGGIAIYACPVTNTVTNIFVSQAMIKEE